MKALNCTLVMSLMLVLPAPAQLPDFYKTVDRLIWVVDDLDRTTQGWQKLGFTGIEYQGETELPALFRGKPGTATLRAASGRIGDVPVHWVQPVSGKDAFSEFLARKGSGVFSIMHRVPSSEAFDAEVKRMASLGVGVLQGGEVETDAGMIRFAFLDTAAQGKYALGLIHVPGQTDAALAPPGNPSGRKVVQYAFVAKDLDAVSAYWARLGFPAMTYTHPDMSELRYRDRPGAFDMRLGWQRHGKVTYEWILSLKGPNVYEDHMKKHGEGVHHLAFEVEDIDKEAADWQARGFPFGMGGAWGQKGKPGSGRFVYLDTHAIGGIDIELLWSFRAK